jgi:uncharacterized repeat protein (TIGR01451 family)
LSIGRKTRRFLRLLAVPMTLALLPVAGVAAPGAILFSDNFNDATLAPWTTTNAARSGILTGAQVAASGSAAYTRNDVVTVTSPTFNAAVPAARLTMWIRRGSDAIPGSEDTDAGEDFYVEYQRADLTWGVVQIYLGSGTNGQIYVVTEIAIPPPLTIGTCDDFEFGLGNWIVNQTTGFAGISAATSSSPSNSLFLNGGVVNVDSIVIDTSDVSLNNLTVWIRRGADSFSEDPDNGENLVVEYLNDVATWVALETFNGAGAQGQIFVRSYNLPAAGRHVNFQLRFRMTDGDGAPWDFWHVDDVCFDRVIAPGLLISKVALTLTDPINGGSNPKAIPGAVIRYTVDVANQGLGSPDSNSIVITDPLPAGTALFVDTSGGDPIVFINGAISSGLLYNYATDVTFSNQVGGGPPYSYVPVPDAQGFDPVVTGYRINPTGLMNPTVGSNVPSFSIQLRVRIE